MYYPNHCMKHCCTFEQGISHPQRLCNMPHIMLLFIRVIRGIIRKYILEVK